MVYIAQEQPSASLAKPPLYQNRFGDITADPDDVIRVLPDMEMVEDLLGEALFVGGSLVPVYWIADTLVRRMSPELPETSRNIFSVALAGGAFHLLCEAVGINDWYLTHSVAARKARKQFYVVSSSPAGQTIDMEARSPVAPDSKPSCGCNNPLGICPAQFRHLLGM